MTAGWHLAQFNIVRMKYPLDSPEMADFRAQLDPLNELGDGSPGFVWRHVDATGSSTSTRVFPDDPDVLINYTVWESVEALHAYTYKTDHVQALRRRRDWFEQVEGLPVLVMWWTPAGDPPTIDEAIRRLEHLRDHGPGPKAFTFRPTFDPPA